MATFDINDVARRVQYISTGQDGPYAFNFQVNQASELLVYRNDTAQTDSLQYNATIGGDGTGSITFIDNSGGGGEDYTPVNGDVITIIGDQALGRTTAFTTGQISVANTLETEFDNVVIRQQQIKEITDRSLQLKPTTGRTVTGSGTSGPLYFPYDTTVANNANRVLKYDSNGTSLELGSTSTNIDALAAIASDITTVSGISSNVTTVAGIASNVTSVASNASNINTVATNIANVNTVAGISSNVTTVAGLSTEITALSGVSSQDLIDVAALGPELQTLAPIASDISTVAGVSGNVTTVAGISSDVSTVSGISANTTTVAGISGNVTTVAGISSDVSTVAGISANVTTVAGDTANIATVAGNTTNINTVATNITDVNTFANRYRIAATDPTTSLDIGDLYYDTTNDIMKVYGSSGWQNAGSSVNGTSARFQYSVSSSTTTITGTDDNGNSLLYDAGYVDVYLNGIKMVNGSDVTVTSGTSVVFATAIGTSGTDTVDIIAYGTFNVAAIDATSITSGTLGYARGGTGLGALGSADEVLQMNAGGTALEYGKVDTANIADDAVGATQLDVSGNGTAGQVLKSDGDGTFSWADSASPFAYNAVSGATPSLDVGTYNFFNQGTLTADTTVSFTNVPTEAQWTYTFEPAIGTGYDLQNITNTGRTFAPTITSSYGLHVGDNGTKLYIGLLSSTAADNYVNQYSLSTPYDISTASYVQQYSTNKTYLIDVTFNPNGTKFYTVNFAGADAGKIHEFTLGTAWDISSASFTTSFSVTGQMAASYPRAFTFNDDGTIGYINDTTNNIIFQYTLTTAYDISTMSYATKSFSVGSTHQTFELNDDGTKLFINHVSGTYIDTIREYSLSTAWDISTASYASIDYDYSAISASLSSLHFSNSGASLYMMDTAGTTVYEFSTGEVFSLTLPSSLQNTPAETVGSTGRYTYEFWTADGGTNVYISNEEKFS